MKIMKKDLNSQTPEEVVKTAADLQSKLGNNSSRFLSIEELSILYKKQEENLIDTDMPHIPASNKLQ